MPEVPHHAHEVTLSFRNDITATITEQLLRYCDNYKIWYAMKHEHREDGTVHMHIGCVNEIVTNGNEDDPKAGAQTNSNMKRQILKRCPAVMAAFVNNHHGIVVAAMKSSVWIAEYLQKDGDLVYKKLPRDLVELRPYFADLLSKKVANPEYEAWEKVYEDEKWAMPATSETALQFFGHHMYVARDMKIVSDKKRLTERCDAFVCFVNGVAPSHPSKSTSSRETSRACSHCPERIRIHGVGEQQILPKHRKMCDHCYSASGRLAPGQ